MLPITTQTIPGFKAGIRVQLSWLAPYLSVPPRITLSNFTNYLIAQVFKKEFNIGGIGQTRLRERILTWIIRWVPSRTGGLRQWLHDNQAYSLNSTKNALLLQYTLTPPPQHKRPLTIVNPKHKNDIGYAQITLPQPREPKIKTRVNIDHLTPMGAYYRLSDPLAISGWWAAMLRYVDQEIDYEAQAFFTSIQIKIII